MPKKTTLNELGDMLAHVVEHMATKHDLTRFATKDDLRRFATKDDVRTIVREETNDMRGDIASMRRDLDGLTEKVDNLAGLPKEIDHALERVATIEKHPAIQRRVA